LFNAMLAAQRAPLPSSFVPPHSAEAAARWAEVAARGLAPLPPAVVLFSFHLPAFDATPWE
jgi:hypothetical protein